MNENTLLLAIKDSEGKYVDGNSIWKEGMGRCKKPKWHYTSKSGYEFDCSMKNRDTGVRLYISESEAVTAIQKLVNDLHKVGLKRTFHTEIVG